MIEREVFTDVCVPRIIKREVWCIW